MLARPILQVHKQLHIKMWISNLVSTLCFWNNLKENRKIGKPNNLDVFGSNKAERPKQDIQIGLWS